MPLRCGLLLKSHYRVRAEGKNLKILYKNKSAIPQIGKILLKEEEIFRRRFGLCRNLCRPHMIKTILAKVRRSESLPPFAKVTKVETHSNKSTILVSLPLSKHTAACRLTAQVVPLPRSSYLLAMKYSPKCPLRQWAGKSRSRPWKMCSLSLYIVIDGFSRDIDCGRSFVFMSSPAMPRTITLRAPHTPPSLPKQNIQSVPQCTSYRVSQRSVNAHTLVKGFTLSIFMK